MLNLIVFLAISYAIVNIYSTEYIFSKIRLKMDFKPFNCPYCLSVWVGFATSWAFDTICSVYVDWFIYGMLSYVGYKLFKKILGDDLQIG